MPATAMPWKGMYSHPTSSGSISGLYTRSSIIKFTFKIVLATGGEDGRKVRPPGEPTEGYCKSLGKRRCMESGGLFPGTGKLKERFRAILGRCQEQPVEEDILET